MGNSSNCFNYAAVVSDQHGQIVVRIWNRIWSAKHKDFRDDPDYRPPGKLYAEHVLPIRLSSFHQTEAKRIAISFNESSCSSIVPVCKTDFVTDSPPIVDVWVGRNTELSSVDRFQSGVIVVTGIGGQGKSAFASKYLEKWCQINPGRFWDWRDCREQREQFHTKLVTIIEHASNGKLLGSSLEGAETIDLVRVFFELVKDMQGLIVLDNLDHYVDVSSGKFTLGVGKFVEAALQYRHNFTILLTCRPRVNYASPRFYEVHLKGILSSEAVDLFQRRGVKIVNEVDVTALHKIHALTEGHPLWLNLIATQVANLLANYEDIIADLEQGQVDDRARTMMTGIWKGLNYRQEVVLRYMAELSRPEDIDWIHECVKDEIKSWNQFRRAFQGLQALNLVIESQGRRGQREFDLHPIVRNFIRTEFYSRKEREPFLNRVIWVVDTYISRCAKTVSIVTPFSLIEYWIFKAVLALRKDDLETACKTLVDIGEKLVVRGMPGELFRVGELLLERCEGRHEKLIDLDDFHELNKLMGHAYAEYGRKEDAIKHTDRYTRLIPKDTAPYIGVCDTRCYIEWIFGNYEEAIYWGREGVRIKRDSKIDTRFDSSHNLALALRDSRKDLNHLDEALTIFLEGATVASVLDSNIKETRKGAAFFGNIGRCLQFQGHTEQALRCFVKSACILERDEESISILNRGYASLWIGEILEDKGDYAMAYMLFKRAENIWTQRAPLKVEAAHKRLESLEEKCKDAELPLQVTDAGIEREVKQWIEGFDSSSIDDASLTIE